MVQAFADAGCSLEGGTIDSVWAVLYGRLDGLPLSAFAARAGSFVLPRQLEPVAVGERTFWATSERDLTVVFWEDAGHGLICGAAACTEASQLIALAKRLDAPRHEDPRSQ